jgi:hypothetical protein
MIDLLYRARAKVSPLWGGRTRFIALGGVAIGLVLVADGYTPLGAVLLVASVPVSWLTGMWMMPGSVDAYFVKISNVMNESAVNWRSENVWLRQRLGDITTKINHLEPPQKRLDLHLRILADVGSIGEILDDQSGKFVDRATRLVQPSQSLRRAYTELDESESDPGEQYLKEVVSLLARYRRCIDESRARNVKWLRRLVRRTEKLRRPGSLADSHNDYLRILDSYISCMVAYYAAAQDSDTEAVRRAAATAEMAHTRFEDRSRDYFAELLAKSHRGFAGGGKGSVVE